MSFYDDLLKTTEPVRAVASNLRALASAFLQTGNKPVAERLYDAATKLDASAADVRRIAGEKVDADFKLSQEHSATILSAVMAGAVVERRGGDFPSGSTANPSGGE